MVQVSISRAFNLVVLRTPPYVLIPEPSLWICDFAGFWYASGISLLKTPPSGGSNVDPGLRTTVLTNILEEGKTQKSLNIQCIWKCELFTELSVQPMVWQTSFQRQSLEIRDVVLVLSD